MRQFFVRKFYVLLITDWRIVVVFVPCSAKGHVSHSYFHRTLIELAVEVVFFSVLFLVPSIILCNSKRF